MGHVRLVAATNVMWPVLIDSCVQLFGRSPTRELDARSISLDDCRAYRKVLCTLFDNKGDKWMDFIHLTFMIHFEDQDQMSEFINLTKMNVHSFNNCIICCLSLREAKTVVELGSVESVMPETRKTCNGLYVALDQLGFKDLFKNRRAQVDGTFLLK